MDKESRVLVGSVLIILVAVISFNFNDISGETISGVSNIVEVSPEVVSSGDLLFVSVFPGSEGINNIAHFYRVNDNLRVGSIEFCGNSYRCLQKTSFSYTVPNNWEPGVYSIKVFDYGSNQLAGVIFTVI